MLQLVTVISASMWFEGVDLDIPILLIVANACTLSGSLNGSLTS